VRHHLACLVLVVGACARWADRWNSERIRWERRLVVEVQVQLADWVGSTNKSAALDRDVLLDGEANFLKVRSVVTAVPSLFVIRVHEYCTGEREVATNRSVAQQTRRRNSEGAGVLRAVDRAAALSAENLVHGVRSSEDDDIEEELSTVLKCLSSGSESLSDVVVELSVQVKANKCPVEAIKVG